VDDMRFAYAKSAPCFKGDDFGRTDVMWRHMTYAVAIGAQLQKCFSDRTRRAPRSSSSTRTAALPECDYESGGNKRTV
jgi:hypothetical protein